MLLRVSYSSVGLSRCAQNGPLNRWLPWKTRLRSEEDIAHALAAFSKPFVHGDVNPSNVLLDKNLIPKLCNFSLCGSILEGEMAGTSGFIDPENLHTGFVTEFFYLSSEQEKPAVDLDFILTKLVKRNRGMK